MQPHVGSMFITNSYEQHNQDVENPNTLKMIPCSPHSTQTKTNPLAQTLDFSHVFFFYVFGSTVTRGSRGERTRDTTARHGGAGTTELFAHASADLVKDYSPVRVTDPLVTRLQLMFVELKNV